MSAPAAALAEGVIKAMFVTNVKAGAALVLALSLLAAGAGLAAHQSLAPRSATPTSGDAAQPESKSAEPLKPERTKRARTDRYGDPLPEGAIARIGTVRFRHGEAVRSVAFSPSGGELASASVDGTIRRWDLATGKELWRFEKSHAWNSICVAFSADGKS